MEQTIKPGDVLLCYAPSWLGEGIDLFEALGALRSQKKLPEHRPIYSHAALCVGDGKLIEAVGKGVVYGTIETYKGVADVWRTPLTDAQRFEIIRYAEALVKKKITYNDWDIVVQAFYLLTGFMLPHWLNKSVICSVAVYDEFHAANPRIQVAARRNCTPEDLAMYGALRFAFAW